MLHLGRISDISRDYDENWLIVRSVKQVPRNAVQVSALSPSTSLFYKYLDAKKAGRFDGAWFQSVYVPTFLREVIANQDARSLLNQLYAESRRKSILLACFCPNEALCHRSVIAGLLLGAGADIDCNPSYRKYFDLYKSMLRA